MNMKEIKFRAWDVINKKMYPVAFPIWNWIIEWKIDFTNHTIEKIDSDWDDRPIVMQYTWLKDKNGKEVYEWDIVISQDVEWVVKMVDWAFDIYKDDTKQYYDDMRQIYFTESSMEIIGNIYENPELLQSN
jgi:uncharacterized phage protein (TIGR01671 family)